MSGTKYLTREEQAAMQRALRASTTLVNPGIVREDWGIWETIGRGMVPPEPNVFENCSWHQFPADSTGLVRTRPWMPEAWY